MQRKNQHHPLFWLAPLAALPLIACAATQLDETTLLDTQSAIAAAEEIDTQSEPDVELHIQYAKEQMALAKQLAADGDGEEADRTLERALADAQLARGMARSEQAQAEATAAWNEVQELRE